MPSEINVKDAPYYAAGDGNREDDTISIQKALNDIDVDGTVTIPPGIYKLRKATSHYAVLAKGNFVNTYFALRVMRKCKIVAQGAIFLVDTSVGPSDATPVDRYGAFWALEVDGININGGSIFGTAPSLTGSQTSRPGIVLQNCSNCVISNMTIRNLTQGINIYNSDYCTVKNITSSDHRYSGIMFFESSNSTVENCNVKNCGDGHISLYNSSYIQATGCTVQETRWAEETGHVVEQGITLEHNTGSSILNCTLDGFYYGVDCKNLTEKCNVENNNFRHNLYSVVIRNGDKDNPLDPSSDITIKGNVMTDKRPGVPNSDGDMTWGAPVYITGGTGHIVIDNSADSSPNEVCETINPNVTIRDNLKNIPATV